VTHKLSELKIKDCRHHPRGSVRRASGFVLTGKPEVIPQERRGREVLVLYLKRPRVKIYRSDAL